MEKKSYRFISDSEPSDKQLKQLMKEVALDVRQKADDANARFQEQLSKMCITVRKEQNLK